MYACRFTEDGCPHKKFFHTRYLMRMRLTPDCSKMLISTSSGYLLILHDLDLTQSLEVGSYRILRARRAPLSTGMHVKRFTHLLFAKERFSIKAFVEDLHRTDTDMKQQNKKTCNCKKQEFNFSIKIC